MVIFDLKIDMVSFEEGFLYLKPVLKSWYMTPPSKICMSYVRNIPPSGEPIGSSKLKFSRYFIHISFIFHSYFIYISFIFHLYFTFHSHFIHISSIFHSHFILLIKSYRKWKFAARCESCNTPPFGLPVGIVTQEVEILKFSKPSGMKSL